MHYTLLQVLRGNWYIDHAFAQGAGFFVKSLFERKLILEGDSKHFLPKVEHYEYSAGESSRKTAAIAVIDISGPLMKGDQECGPAGMDTIGQWIKNFDNDSDVDAILLKIDSPGGTVAGTALLAETVKACQKPIVAFIDEMAASAAYWIASQADHVYASTKRAQVGSLGTMLSFMDVQPLWEKEGAVFHDIVSNLSPEKNKTFHDLQKGKYEDYKKEVLDPLTQDFHDAILATRKITDETILKGRVVFADEAITIGLVDAIKSFDETVDFIQTLVSLEDMPVNNPISSTKNNNTMNKFQNVATALGVEAIEFQDGFASFSEESLATLEERLSATASLEGETATLREELDAANAGNEEMNARITELEAENAKLRETPADPPGVVAPANEPANEPSEKDDVKFYRDNEDDPVACMEQLAKDRPDLRLDSF